MLELKNGQFGVNLLALIGYCGEFPAALPGQLGGYYDYNRRVATKLIREGYLRERRMKGYSRHIVRSWSLTEQGLRKLQQLAPQTARQIRGNLLAPPNGQGDWKKTLRLHRNTACLLMVMKAGAVWKPGSTKASSRNFKLVYYGAYEFNRMFEKDNKGSRASGILLGSLYYFPLYYPGDRNMQWSESAEEIFRSNFEYSPIGDRHIFGGNVFIGQNWSLAENLIVNASRPYSRLIPASKVGNYFMVLDEYGPKMLRILAGENENDLFRRALYEAGLPYNHAYNNLLFDLGIVSGFYHNPDRQKTFHLPADNHFFDFQMEVTQRVNHIDARLISLPADLLNNKS